MKKYTKEEAIRIVTSCAEKYNAELVEKTLLFVCMDKHKRVSCMEFSFHGSNYLHLTGLKVQEASETLTASDFFQRCLAHKLSPKDFEFSDDGTTHMKLSVLSSVLCKNLAASMIGEYHAEKPVLYTEKLAGGTRACMGFVVDGVSGKYVPNTVLKADLRDHVSHYLRVIAVYRKEAAAETYSEQTYQAKKIDLTELTYPEEYRYLKNLCGEETLPIH